MQDQGQGCIHEFPRCKSITNWTVYSTPNTVWASSPAGPGSVTPSCSIKVYPGILEPTPDHNIIVHQDHSCDTWRPAELKSRPVNADLPQGVVYLGTEWASNPVVRSDIVVSHFLDSVGGYRHKERRDKLLSLLDVDLDWYVTLQSALPPPHQVPGLWRSLCCTVLTRPAGTCTRSRMVSEGESNCVWVSWVNGTSFYSTRYVTFSPKLLFAIMFNKLTDMIGDCRFGRIGQV